MQQEAGTTTTVGVVSFAGLPAGAAAQHLAGFTVTIPIARGGLLTVTSTQVDFVSGSLLHQVTFNGNGVPFSPVLEEDLLATVQEGVPDLRLRLLGAPRDPACGPPFGRRGMRSHSGRGCMTDGGATVERPQACAGAPAGLVMAGLLGLILLGSVAAEAGASSSGSASLTQARKDLLVLSDMPAGWKSTRTRTPATTPWVPRSWPPASGSPPRSFRRSPVGQQPAVPEHRAAP